MDPDLIQPQRLHIEAQHHAGGFLVTLRQWMGRMWSTCGSLSYHLYRLISKTHRTVKPVLEKNNLGKDDNPLRHQKESDRHIFSPLSSPKSNLVTPSKSPSPSSPLQKDEMLDPLDDSDESKSIVSSLLEKFMKIDDIKNLPLAQVIYNLQIEKLEDKDMQSLNGNFQLEWHFASEDLPAKLIYRGDLQKGIFHGKGLITIEEHDGSAPILLEGSFKEGSLVSGMVVMENCYIEGTFSNGKLNGTGTIHYEPAEDDGVLFIPEYRGEFLNGNPHGEGQTFEFSKNGGMKVTARGNFVAGRLTSGCFQDSIGTIFKGTFSYQERDELFTGRVINLKNKIDYNGECINRRFQGKGELTMLETISQEKFQEVEGAEDAVEAVEEDVIIRTIKKGRFENNELVEGELKMSWNNEDDQEIVAISEVNAGEISETVVTMPDGSKYKGLFDLPEKLSGQGVIYDSDGAEVYQGEIELGYPHGQGKQTLGNGTVREGTFDFGNFKDKE